MLVTRATACLFTHLLLLLIGYLLAKEYQRKQDHRLPLMRHSNLLDKADRAPCYEIKVPCLEKGDESSIEKEERKNIDLCFYICASKNITFLFIHICGDRSQSTDELDKELDFIREKNYFKISETSFTSCKNELLTPSLLEKDFSQLRTFVRHKVPFPLITRRDDLLRALLKELYRFQKRSIDNRKISTKCFKIEDDTFIVSSSTKTVSYCFTNSCCNKKIKKSSYLKKKLFSINSNKHGNAILDEKFSTIDETLRTKSKISNSKKFIDEDVLHAYSIYKHPINIFKYKNKHTKNKNLKNPEPLFKEYLELKGFQDKFVNPFKNHYWTPASRDQNKNIHIVLNDRKIPSINRRNVVQIDYNEVSSSNYRKNFSKFKSSFTNLPSENKKMQLLSNSDRKIAFSVKAKNGSPSNNLRNSMSFNYSTSESPNLKVSKLTSIVKDIPKSSASEKTRFGKNVNTLNDVGFQNKSKRSSSLKVFNNTSNTKDINSDRLDRERKIPQSEHRDKLLTKNSFMDKKSSSQVHWFEMKPEKSTSSVHKNSMPKRLLLTQSEKIPHSERHFQFITELLESGTDQKELKIPSEHDDLNNQKIHSFLAEEAENGKSSIDKRALINSGFIKNKLTDRNIFFTADKIRSLKASNENILKIDKSMKRSMLADEFQEESSTVSESNLDMTFPYSDLPHSENWNIYDKDNKSILWTKSIKNEKGVNETVVSAEETNKYTTKSVLESSRHLENFDSGRILAKSTTQSSAHLNNSTKLLEKFQMTELSTNYSIGKSFPPKTWNVQSNVSSKTDHEKRSTENTNKFTNEDTSSTSQDTIKSLSEVNTMKSRDKVRFSTKLTTQKLGRTTDLGGSPTTYLPLIPVLRASKAPEVDKSVSFLPKTNYYSISEAEKSSSAPRNFLNIDKTPTVTSTGNENPHSTTKNINSVENNSLYTKSLPNSFTENETEISNAFTLEKEFGNSTDFLFDINSDNETIKVNDKNDEIRNYTTLTDTSHGVRGVTQTDNLMNYTEKVIHLSSPKTNNQVTEKDGTSKTNTQETENIKEKSKVLKESSQSFQDIDSKDNRTSKNEILVTYVPESMSDEKGRKNYILNKDSGYGTNKTKIPNIVFSPSTDMNAQHQVIPVGNISLFTDDDFSSDEKNMLSFDEINITFVDGLTTEFKTDRSLSRENDEQTQTNTDTDTSSDKILSHTDRDVLSHTDRDLSVEVEEFGNTFPEENELHIDGKTEISEPDINFDFKIPDKTTTAKYSVTEDVEKNSQLFSESAQSTEDLDHEDDKMFKNEFIVKHTTENLSAKKDGKVYTLDEDLVSMTDKTRTLISTFLPPSDSTVNLKGNHVTLEDNDFSSDTESSYFADEISNSFVDDHTTESQTDTSLFVGNDMQTQNNKDIDNSSDEILIRTDRDLSLKDGSLSVNDKDVADTFSVDDEMQTNTKPGISVSGMNYDFKIPTAEKSFPKNIEESTFINEGISSEIHYKPSDDRTVSEFSVADEIAFSPHYQYNYSTKKGLFLTKGSNDFSESNNEITKSVISEKNLDSFSTVKEPNSSNDNKFPFADSTTSESGKANVNYEHNQIENEFFYDDKEVVSSTMKDKLSSKDFSSAESLDTDYIDETTAYKNENYTTDRHILSSSEIYKLFSSGRTASENDTVNTENQYNNPINEIFRTEREITSLAEKEKKLPYDFSSDEDIVIELMNKDSTLPKESFRTEQLSPSSTVDKLFPSENVLSDENKKVSQDEEFTDIVSVNSLSDNSVSPDSKYNTMPSTDTFFSEDGIMDQFTEMIGDNSLTKQVLSTTGERKLPSVVTSVVNSDGKDLDYEVDKMFKNEFIVKHTTEDLSSKKDGKVYTLNESLVSMTDKTRTLISTFFTPSDSTANLKGNHVTLEDNDFSSDTESPYFVDEISNSFVDDHTTESQTVRSLFVGNDMQTQNNKDIDISSDEILIRTDRDLSLKDGSLFVDLQDVTDTFSVDDELQTNTKPGISVSSMNYDFKIPTAEKSFPKNIEESTFINGGISSEIHYKPSDDRTVSEFSVADEIAFSPHYQDNYSTKKGLFLTKGSNDFSESNNEITKSAISEKNLDSFFTVKEPNSSNDNKFPFADSSTSESGKVNVNYEHNQKENEFFDDDEEIVSSTMKDKLSSKDFSSDESLDTDYTDETTVYKNENYTTDRHILSSSEIYKLFSSGRSVSENDTVNTENQYNNPLNEIFRTEREITSLAEEEKKLPYDFSSDENIVKELMNKDSTLPNESFRTEQLSPSSIDDKLFPSENVLSDENKKVSQDEEFTDIVSVNSLPDNSVSPDNKYNTMPSTDTFFSEDGIVDQFTEIIGDNSLTKQVLSTTEERKLPSVVTSVVNIDAKDFKDETDMPEVENISTNSPTIMLTQNNQVSQTDTSFNQKAGTDQEETTKTFKIAIATEWQKISTSERAPIPTPIISARDESQTTSDSGTTEQSDENVFSELPIQIFTQQNTPPSSDFPFGVELKTNQKEEVTDSADGFIYTEQEKWSTGQREILTSDYITSAKTFLTNQEEKATESIKNTLDTEQNILISSENISAFSVDTLTERNKIEDEQEIFTEEVLKSTNSEWPTFSSSGEGSKIFSVEDTAVVITEKVQLDKVTELAVKITGTESQSVTSPGNKLTSIGVLSKEDDSETKPLGEVTGTESQSTSSAGDKLTSLNVATEEDVTEDQNDDTTFPINELIRTERQVHSSSQDSLDSPNNPTENDDVATKNDQLPSTLDNNSNLSSESELDSELREISTEITSDSIATEEENFSDDQNEDTTFPINELVRTERQVHLSSQDSLDSPNNPTENDSAVTKSDQLPSTLNDNSNLPSDTKLDSELRGISTEIASDSSVSESVERPTKRNTETTFENENTNPDISKSTAGVETSFNADLPKDFSKTLKPYMNQESSTTQVSMTKSNTGYTSLRTTTKEISTVQKTLFSSVTSSIDMGVTNDKTTAESMGKRDVSKSTVTASSDASFSDSVNSSEKVTSSTSGQSIESSTKEISVSNSPSFSTTTTRTTPSTTLKPSTTTNTFSSSEDKKSSVSTTSIPSSDDPPIPFHFTIDADYDKVVGNRKKEFEENLTKQLVVVMRIPLECLQSLKVSKGSVEVNFDLVPNSKYGHMADEKALKAAADELKRRIDNGQINIKDLDGNTLVVVPMDPPTKTPAVNTTEHTTIILAVVIGAFILTVISVAIAAIIIKRKANDVHRLTPIEEVRSKLPSYREIPFQEALFMRGPTKNKLMFGKYCYNTGRWLGPGPEPVPYHPPDSVVYRPPTDSEIRQTPRPSTAVFHNHHRNPISDCETTFGHQQNEQSCKARVKRLKSRERTIKK